MCRKALLIAGILLVGAVVFATPGFGQAAGHGGGGHGGGGHGGGGHFRSAGFGGYGRGVNRSGYGRSFGFRPYTGYHRSYGYHPYYNYGNYYGYDPYYNPYSNSYYNNYFDVGSSPPYDSDNSGIYGEAGSSAPPVVNYQSSNPAATAVAAVAAPDNDAHVTVAVPADAQVWLDGVPTKSTGSIREFNSPPLTPGVRYSYEVQARWNENGKDVTQTQKVEVGAGTHARVDFPIPSNVAGRTPATPKS
jgi:uncharacterized protein (TIGR03000 family)